MCAQLINFFTLYTENFTSFYALLALRQIVLLSKRIDEKNHKINCHYLSDTVYLKKSILQFTRKNLQIFGYGRPLNFQSMLWCIIFVVHVFKNTPFEERLNLFLRKTVYNKRNRHYFNLKLNKFFIYIFCITSMDF